MFADGYSFVFNSVDYGNSSYNVFVNDVDYPELPEPRVDRQPLGGDDGEVTQGATWAARTITIDCLVVETSAGNLDTQLAAIRQQLIATASGEAAFSVDELGSLVWDARLISEFRPRRLKTGASFKLTFLASDPWPRSSSYTTKNETLTGDTTITYTPEGERSTPTRWTVKDGGSGASSVSIHNETTGQLITWSNTMSPGSWLRFNGEGDLIPEVSTDSGSTWTDVVVNTTGVPPRLSGGVSNTIVVYGLTSGTLEMYYKARYR